MQIKIETSSNGKVILDLTLDFTFLNYYRKPCTRIQVESDSLGLALKHLARHVQYAEINKVSTGDFMKDISDMLSNLHRFDFSADLDRAFYFEPVYGSGPDVLGTTKRTPQHQETAGRKPEAGRMVLFVTNELETTVSKENVRRSQAKVIPAMITKVTGDTVSLCLFSDDRANSIPVVQSKIKYNSDAKTPHTWHWPSK